MLARLVAAWPLPAALIVLSLVPMIGSVVSITEIAGNPVETAKNARFLANPWVLYLHGGFGSLYLLLGAFQFSAVIRAQWPKWHRVSGRVAAVAGMIAALAGLYMTEVYPKTHGNPAEVYGFRITFSLVWFGALALGVLSAMRSNIVAHRAWMMRAYAVALGASTTALIQAPWLLTVGLPSPHIFALATGGAWMINLIIVQWLIDRRPRKARP
jgi:uncharacterized membrane protein